MSERNKKIFAAASFGGHWKQLLRITIPLEESFDVVYASTHPKCATMIDKGVSFYVIQDFSRKNIWRLPSTFLDRKSVV